MSSSPPPPEFTPTTPGGVLWGAAAAATTGLGLQYGNLTSNLSAGNETQAHLYDPAFYSIPYRIVGTLFVTAIFITGVVGNVMVVIVVFRTRSMHTPTNCYLVSLAIADLFVLLSATLPNIPEYYLMIDEWIWGRVCCSLLIFLQYLGVNASSLSITAFTVERYIAICHPMKAQTMCTVKRAKRIIGGLWMFGICYNGAWLFLTTLESKAHTDGTNIEVCTFKMERGSYSTIYMADLIMFYIIPLILTCVLYGLIARILFSSTIPSTPGRAQNGGPANSGRSSAASSRVQVIKMLAVVVGMFAFLWLPYRAFVVYNSFATERYKDLWFLMFCRVMVYMNSAINPILYNAMSVKFRRAFKRLLSCGRQGQDPNRYLYSEVNTEAVIHARKPRIIINGGAASMAGQTNDTKTSVL